MINEIWVPLSGFEGHYQISNNARVRSLKSMNYGRIMKKALCRNGYELVYLSMNGERKTLSVHRQVALHFIPNPENKAEVNHINGIRNDNRLENLEWCTKQENIQHSYRLDKPRWYLWRETVMPQDVRDKISKGVSGALHGQAVGVLDTRTGIYYGCIKEAAEARAINPWLVRRDDSGKKYGIIRV